MHIAICVWGIVRSLRFTLESIEHYCLNPIINAGHTYEIYMHTYKFSGVYANKRNGEHGLRLNFSEWKMLNPDHIYVEDQDLFDATTNYSEYHTQGDPWHNEYKSSINHIRALNSLHYLASEVEKDSQFKHFDGIVFLRPDVTYLNELPVYLLEHIPNTLFMPDFHRSCKGGEYNDRMAMGDLKSGLAYGKRFEAALEYSRHAQLHSEKFTYNHLHANNVTVKEIPFRFRRTRANGQPHVRDAKAIVAPRNQKAEPEYSTFFALRWVYTLMEIATEHKIYIWNHDDDENLYCKPHPYISLEQMREYRKLSRRKRLEALSGGPSRSIGSLPAAAPPNVLPTLPDPEGIPVSSFAPKAQYRRHYLDEPSSGEAAVPKSTEFSIHTDPAPQSEVAHGESNPPGSYLFKNNYARLSYNMQEGNTGRLQPRDRDRAGGMDTRARVRQRNAKYNGHSSIYNSRYNNNGYKSHYSPQDPVASSPEGYPPTQRSRPAVSQAPPQAAAKLNYDPSQDQLRNLQRDLQHDAALGRIGMRGAAAGGPAPALGDLGGLGAAGGGALGGLGIPGDLGEGLDAAYKLRGMASRELEEQREARLKKARYLRTTPG